MFFVVSKLFWMLTQPGNFLVLLLLAGVLLQAKTRHRTLGLRVTWAATGLLVVIFVFPVGGWLLTPWESRYPHPAWPAHVDGILILGGGSAPQILAERGMPLAGAASARVIAGAEAWRHYPQAKLVFSGGTGRLLAPGGGDANDAAALFRQLGIDPKSVIFEDRSANTWENFLFTKELVSPKPEETWLLVTSAVHMPRALGVARRLGWNVIAYPSDYLTPKQPAFFLFPFSFIDNLAQVEVVVHEGLGLLAYRLTGKTGSFFPAP